MKKLIKTLFITILLCISISIVVLAETKEFKKSVDANLPSNDYVISNSKEISKEFTVNGSATLDLKGYTLTYKNDSNGNDVLFSINSTGSLTVKNGTLAVEDGYVADLFDNSSSGTLIFENVNLDTSKIVGDYTCLSGEYNFDPTGHIDSSVSGLSVSSSGGVYTLGHKVTIDPNNDENKYDLYIVHNKKITSLDSPSKEGYTFNGWKNGEDSFDLENTSILSELELVADYSLNSSPNTQESINTPQNVYNIVNTGVVYKE